MNRLHPCQKQSFKNRIAEAIQLLPDSAEVVSLVWGSCWLAQLGQRSDTDASWPLILPSTIGASPIKNRGGIEYGVRGSWSQNHAVKFDIQKGFSEFALILYDLFFDIATSKEGSMVNLSPTEEVDGIYSPA